MWRASLVLHFTLHIFSIFSHTLSYRPYFPWFFFQTQVLPSGFEVLHSPTHIWSLVLSHTLSTVCPLSLLFLDSFLTLSLLFLSLLFLFFLFTLSHTLYSSRTFSLLFLYSVFRLFVLFSSLPFLFSLFTLSHTLYSLHSFLTFLDLFLTVPLPFFYSFFTLSVLFRYSVFTLSLRFLHAFFTLSLTHKQEWLLHKSQSSAKRTTRDLRALCPTMTLFRIARLRKFVGRKFVGRKYGWVRDMTHWYVKEHDARLKGALSTIAWLKVSTIARLHYPLSTFVRLKGALCIIPALFCANLRVRGTQSLGWVRERCATWLIHMSRTLASWSVA